MVTVMRHDMRRAIRHLLGHRANVLLSAGPGASRRRPAVRSLRESREATWRRAQNRVKPDHRAVRGGPHGFFTARMNLPRCGIRSCTRKIGRRQGESRQNGAFWSALLSPEYMVTDTVKDSVYCHGHGRYERNKFRPQMLSHCRRKFSYIPVHKQSDRRHPMPADHWTNQVRHRSHGHGCEWSHHGNEPHFSGHVCD